MATTDATSCASRTILGAAPLLRIRARSARASRTIRPKFRHIARNTTTFTIRPHATCRGGRLGRTSDLAHGRGAAQPRLARAFAERSSHAPTRRGSHELRAAPNPDRADRADRC
jgi:hypothetical protein